MREPSEEMARPEMEVVFSPSFTADQLAPPSVDTYTPTSVPAYTMLADRGDTATAVTRPEGSPFPTGCHVAPASVDTSAWTLSPAYSTFGSDGAMANERNCALGTSSATQLDPPSVDLNRPSVAAYTVDLVERSGTTASTSEPGNPELT